MVTVRGALGAAESLLPTPLAERSYIMGQMEYLPTEAFSTKANSKLFVFSPTICLYISRVNIIHLHMIKKMEKSAKKSIGNQTESCISVFQTRRLSFLSIF